MGRIDVTSLGGGDLAFPQTLWSQVLAAGDPGQARHREAIEALAARYWKPIYAFIRFRWAKDNEEAKDLTQAFVASLIERGSLADVGPEKGRFRSFLKAALGNFLRNARRDELRLKRGSGAARVPLDEVEGIAAAGPDPAASAEEAFDRAWRSEVIGRAIEDLRTTLEREARPTRWLVFEAIVLADGDARPTYDEVAARLRIKPTDVTNHLHAARMTLRELLRSALLESLSDPSSLPDEWKSVLG